MEGIGWPDAGRVLVHLASRIGEARQAQLGQFQNEARLGRLGWATQKMENGEGKEEAGRAGLSFWLCFGPLPNMN
jgi:hypothetical protein